MTRFSPRYIAQSLIHFYQRYISPISGGSCRYYPSCSEYALWQFATNGLFSAFFLSFIRILRCNKLFRGGIDYPVISWNIPHIAPLAPNRCLYSQPIRYFFIEKKRGHFYCIKVLRS